MKMCSVIWPDLIRLPPLPSLSFYPQCLKWVNEQNLRHDYKELFIMDSGKQQQSRTTTGCVTHPFPEKYVGRTFNPQVAVAPHLLYKINDVFPNFRATENKHVWIPSAEWWVHTMIKFGNYNSCQTTQQLPGILQTSLFLVIKHWASVEPQCGYPKIWWEKFQQFSIFNHKKCYCSEMLPSQWC